MIAGAPVARALDAEPPRNFTTTLLSTLCLGLLIIAASWIVRPFAAAGIWAAMIVVVTWPMLLALQRRLWHRRGLAVAVMMTMLLLLLVLPLTLAVGTIVSNTDEIANRVRGLSQAPTFDAPAWIAQIPVAGPRLSVAWGDLVAGGLEGLWTRFLPHAGGVAGWVARRAGGLGYVVGQFVLTLVLAAFMYAHGERATAGVLRLGYRLGGEQGADLVRLAARAVRGVALGVGVTAVVQSLLAGAGLAIAGVPFAALLTAVLFVLCIAQVGMLIVLIPAAIWVYWSGHPGLGTLLLAWSFATSLLDNLLRPMLVRHSADLPLLLIFVGVVGGLIAFGPLGIFVGPVVLAVAYTLLTTWVGAGPVAPAHPSTPIAAPRPVDEALDVSSHS